MRGCAAPLHRRPGLWSCPHGHTFDIARLGYVNLLQPQDRKSIDAGDSRAAVEARAQLLDEGVGLATIDAVARAGANLTADTDTPVVVDLGCGSGDALGRLAAIRPIDGIGIDLSVDAVTRAARRFPALTWIVSNADRRLPVLDARADLVMSVHARRNPSECHRVVAAGGFLLMAVPAADDLLELRSLVQGNAIERERVSGLVAEHADLFRLVDQRTVRQQHHLDREALLALLRGTYRGERLSASAHVNRLDHLTVTLASEVLTFAPR